MPSESSADEHFHQVGRLFPGEVVAVVVTPETTVGEAIAIMEQGRYSQLPVVTEGRLRGAFSLWSLARLVRLLPPRVDIQSVAVGEVMDRIPAVTVNDSLHDVMTLLDQHEAMVVDSPHGIQAVATSTDVLRYFYRIAWPFICLQEIELSLRRLILACASGERLQACVDRALRARYEQRGQEVPGTLAEMSFDDYRSIIIAKDNWPTFEGVLGRNRMLVASKLERIRDLRNTVFHFRAELSVLDTGTLIAERNWLLDKARYAQISREEEPNG